MTISFLSSKFFYVNVITIIIIMIMMQDMWDFPIRRQASSGLRCFPLGLRRQSGSKPGHSCATCTLTSLPRLSVSSCCTHQEINPVQVSRHTSPCIRRPIYSCSSLSRKYRA
jgi:hypothetical protein